MRIFTFFLRATLPVLMLAVASLAAEAKEFKTTLAKGVEITYLVNTTDKIARVKLVEEVEPSSASKITIPEKVTYKSGSKSYTLTVVGISERALCSTWFTKVNLPSTLKTIGKEAFYSSNIKSIELPSKLETIGEGAFRDSQLGGTVTIPAKCTSIGKTAFTNTYITELNVLQGASPLPLALGDGAFSGSDLVNVHIIRVGSMGEYVFGNCQKLQQVDLSGNLPVLPAQTFNRCKSLTRVGMPVVTSIGNFAFWGCTSLREFDFLPGLEKIGDSAFLESGLVAVRLKEGFRTMEEDAFFNCPNLQIVELPSTTTSIGSAAFQNSLNITSVSCEAATPPAMLNDAFSRYRNITVWVPSASIDAYESAPGWRCFDYDHLKQLGIETPEVSEPGEKTQLFDLQGNPIADPESHRGMMIEVRDGKARKVIR